MSNIKKQPIPVLTSDKDLNNILSTYADDPNNELRTYTDSPYVTMESLAKLLTTKIHKFSILSLNIQSLNSKFDSLTATLSYLESNNIRFSAICLQETWLNECQDISIFNIPGYNIIHSGKSCSECGGLLIYLHDSYSYKIKSVYKNSKLWEGLFIEVQGGNLNSKIVIGNIYRPPKHNNNNGTIENFISEITPIILNTAKSNSNIIINGDFNIDLIQINERAKFQKYFDLFVTNGLFPLITLPTRESKHNATLINKIFYKVKIFMI